MNKKKTSASQLNLRQRRFCEEYIKGQHAGKKGKCYSIVYNNKNLHSSSTNAIKLLKKECIQDYIKQLEQEFKDEIYSAVRGRLKVAINTSWHIISDPEHRQFSAVFAQLVKLWCMAEDKDNSGGADFNLNITFDD